MKCGVTLWKLLSIKKNELLIQTTCISLWRVMLSEKIQFQRATCANVFK